MNILYNPTGCSTTSFIRPHLGRSRQHEYPIQSNRLQYNEFHPSSSGRQHEYPIQSNRLQYNEFHPSSSGGIDQRISLNIDESSARFYPKRGRKSSGLRQHEYPNRLQYNEFHPSSSDHGYIGNDFSQKQSKCSVDIHRGTSKLPLGVTSVSQSQADTLLSSIWTSSARLVLGDKFGYSQTENTTFKNTKHQMTEPQALL
ncbi:unnamed protein product [Protopolystoma xenopodis]|uniref:Uncharacterized protein n=1 Tax=Protopolystoma xenopodis TaxID=117903 RepID=A0A3S5CT77_9PLAT|nr:unnamed protein product [Protopolystoma xenopodis]